MLSKAVISAKIFPTSSCATTEAMTDRDIGEKTLLNSDSDTAETRWRIDQLSRV